jgi:undecaprenyl-diphosphatase
MADDAPSADLPLLTAAALLGVAEGLTEFLPVSSTGHLIALTDIFGVPTPPGRVFEVVIQFGAILAVVVAYRVRLLALVLAALRGNRSAWSFGIGLALACLPAVALGVLFRDFIKEVLFSTEVVAVALVVGGVAILAIERVKVAPRVARAEEVPPLLAVAIGCVQCLALVPGVSRSGATVLGALMMGVERRAAAEFSFFLAIPIMLGASGYDLWKSRDLLDSGDMAMIGAGFGAAFLAALVIVRPFVRFVGRYGFAPFAWYRIAFGSALLLWIALRG